MRTTSRKRCGILIFESEIMSGGIGSVVHHPPPVSELYTCLVIGATQTMTRQAHITGLMMGYLAALMGGGGGTKSVAASPSKADLAVLAAVWCLPSGGGGCGVMLT